MPTTSSASDHPVSQIQTTTSSNIASPSPTYYGFANEQAARTLVEAASDAFLSLNAVAPQPSTASSMPSSNPMGSQHDDPMAVPFAPLFQATNAQLSAIQHLDPSKVNHNVAVALLQRLLLTTHECVVPVASPPPGPAGGGPARSGSGGSRQTHTSFMLDKDGKQLQHYQRPLARNHSYDSLRGVSPQLHGNHPQQDDRSVSPLPIHVAASPFLGGIAASFRKVRFASGDYSNAASPVPSAGIATPASVQEFEKLIREPSENPNAYGVGDDEDDDDVIGSSINGWMLIGDLGRGSYGQVMLACHSETDDIAAIKIVHRSIFNRERRRALLPSAGSSQMLNQPNKDKDSSPPQQGIRREIAVMKRLKHRHLVQLKAVIDDADADRLYLVMQYVPHGPFLPRRKEFTSFHRTEAIAEVKARRYARQLISALRYLHSNNIVHRDVKPENILRGDNDTLFLADFGVSEIVDDLEVTRNVTGTHGTPAFWPPELFDDSNENPSSAVDGIRQDEWALSVTIYLMLVGRLPFEGASLHELGQSILHDRVLVPDDLSHNVRDFLRKALDRDAKARLTLNDMRKHPFIVGPKTSRVRDRLQSKIEAAPKDQSPIAVPELAPPPPPSDGGVSDHNSGRRRPQSTTGIPDGGKNADGSPRDRTHQKPSMTPNPPPALKPASTAPKTDPTTSSPLMTTGGASFDADSQQHLLPAPKPEAENPDLRLPPHGSDDTAAEAEATPGSGISLGESAIIEHARIDRNRGAALGIGRHGASAANLHGSPVTNSRDHPASRFPGVEMTQSAAASPQPLSTTPMQINVDHDSPHESAHTLPPLSTHHGHDHHHHHHHDDDDDDGQHRLPVMLPPAVQAPVTPPRALRAPNHGEAYRSASPVGPNFSRLAAIAVEQGGLLTPNHSRAAAQAAISNGAFELVSPNARARREASRMYAAFEDFDTDEDPFGEDSLSDFDSSAHPASTGGGGGSDGSQPSGNSFGGTAGRRRARRRSSATNHTDEDVASPLGIISQPRRQLQAVDAADQPRRMRRASTQGEAAMLGNANSSPGPVEPHASNNTGASRLGAGSVSAANLTRTGSYSVMQALRTATSTAAPSPAGSVSVSRQSPRQTSTQR